MQLFRIAKTKYIKDLTGAGSRTYGGRWNRKGVGLIYASESRSLAALEFLVHVPASIAPRDLSIVTLDIPPQVKPKKLDLAILPPNWRQNPPPEELATIGTEWAQSNESLLLRVPSAIIENEFNVLINPSHPDLKLIKLSKPEPFVFDERLIKSKG
ncbi:MAG TPA: RES family NAD+ phosphorylase [Thermodesulfobacteriota bacterium]|nr:RES family NAD+ phosphorylase [Thermodesulfobacteriota bacterium]